MLTPPTVAVAVATTAVPAAAAWLGEAAAGLGAAAAEGVVVVAEPELVDELPQAARVIGAIMRAQVTVNDRRFIIIGTFFAGVECPQ